LREANYSRDASKTGTTAPADTTVVLIPEMPETVRKSATEIRSSREASNNSPCRVPTAHCQQRQQQQGWQLQRQEENSRDDSNITAPTEGAGTLAKKGSTAAAIRASKQYL
jgi:hypothetical protein